MNKKGFTLVEIIICISMLVVIVVGSFIGIRMVNNNLTIKELKQITNKAIQASQVYIETNKEAQTQLYTEQNVVKIPLKVLVNEGLLSLKGTNLDDNKIKDEYVITALSTESGTSTECTNIDSKASWDADKVIYICTNLNSKGEVTGSNLATIDPTKYNNRTKASNEPYYFQGKESNNYVRISDTNITCGKRNQYRLDEASDVRILYIDRNDDILIVVNDSNYYGHCTKDDTMIYTSKVTENQIYNTFNLLSYYNKGKVNNDFIGSSWLGSIYYSSGGSNISYQYYMRMPSGCKIDGGTGAIDNNFIIKCS